MAIVAVMLFHGGYLQGGDVGVDIFFVLSGFLITGILLDGHARTGRFVTLSFWRRRARRLLPALVILGAIVAAYVFAIASPAEARLIRSDALATAFYFQNYRTVFTIRSASRLAVPFRSPLAHTWSLSVEEQFYAIWPIALGLLAIGTRKNNRRLFVAIVVMMLLSALLMLRWYLPSNTARAYFSTETRAQALLAGCALAVATRAWRPSTRRSVGYAFEIAGIVGIVFLAWVMTTTTTSTAWLFRGGYLLVALSAAAVIAAAARPSSPAVRRVLSLRPLAGVGLISYGLYLFHLPILLWLERDNLGYTNLERVTFAFGLTLAIALLSYFLVERPVLQGGWTWRTVQFVPVAVGCALVPVLALSAVASIGPGELAALWYRNQSRETPAFVTKVLVAGDGQAFGLVKDGTAYSGHGTHGVTAAALCDLAPGQVVIRGRTASTRPCSPFASFAAADNAFRPDVTVLLLGSTELLDRNRDGTIDRVGTRGFSQALTGRLERARQALTAHGERLIILTLPCGAPAPAASADIRARSDPVRIATFNALLRMFAAAHSDSVQLADYGSLWCHGSSRSAAATGAFEADGSLSPSGATETWEWLSGLARARIDRAP